MCVPVEAKPSKDLSGQRICQRRSEMACAQILIPALVVVVRHNSCRLRYFDFRLRVFLIPTYNTSPLAFSDQMNVMCVSEHPIPLSWSHAIRIFLHTTDLSFQ